MVRRGAKTLHLELEGESYDGVSQNVCAGEFRRRGKRSPSPRGSFNITNSA